MTRISYTVEPGTPRQLAKYYLKRRCGISSTLWKKIKNCGQFWLNDEAVRASQAFVQGGDTVEYELPAPKSAVEPVSLPLDIAYEDDYLLIAAKPAGMLTHPLTFEKNCTLANAVMYHFQQNGITCGCHPLYRLDRNTSGLVVFAKLPQIQHRLSGHDRLRRSYLAIVQGSPADDAGTINAPIGRQDGSIILHCVRPDGKRAVTHYRVLQRCGSFSLVELQLETGRTHQIRVHMAHIGHPLLGDDLYGGSRSLIGRQALHACKVEFDHPFSGEHIAVESPLPPDMQQLL